MPSHTWGTMVRLVMYAPNPEVADRAAAGAFATFTRLDSLFSDYREDSEIGLLATEAGSGHPRSVSPELLEILEIAEQWRDQSGGAFSVTVGPMTRLWRWAIRRGELPGADRLDAARLQADPAGMEVLVRTGTASETRTVPRPGTGTATGTATGTRTGTVTLNVAGMSLDLGGIAKGYAAQKVVDQLAEQGLSQVLVDAGGDMVLGAAPPKQGGWRVEFPDGAVHHLANVAVATSGDRYQYLEVDGVRYSHILDPGTGLGMTDAPTVVVVAPNGAARRCRSLGADRPGRRPSGDRALLAGISGAGRADPAPVSIERRGGGTKQRMRPCAIPSSHRAFPSLEPCPY